MNAMTNRNLPVLLTIATLLVVLGPQDVAMAQRDLPPSRGGMTYSLGMPPVYKGRTGMELQSYRPGDDDELAYFFNLGVSKDLGSPVVGIGGLRLEGYAGTRVRQFDGGGRLLFEMPSLYVGAGVDYNGRDEVADFLFQLDLPLRRGGVFGRGTTLAVRWLPTRDQTFSLGVNVPLWGRNIGATRPRSDNVGLQKSTPMRQDFTAPNDGLQESLADLGERARWIARLSQPFAEAEGADAHEAMAPILATVKSHHDSTNIRFPVGHTLAAEIAAYHQGLDRAFSLAAGGLETTALGRTVSARARSILLDEVLIPYNYLLGQRKKNDSLISMIAIAQTTFASWVILESDVPRADMEAVFHVFQTLGDQWEENRAELRDRWQDSRFVWLPLQYALTPDQHDTQAELDSIIARATKEPFTQENRVWYVINEEFQWEMARSVRQAEDYHVLWIHDYRGVNGAGEPDGIAYAQTLNYLEAMVERVEAYDEAGQLPQYFILLDQFYFETNKARRWLRLLNNPLEYELHLPDGFTEWEERLAATQERLRQAVGNSVLLQVGASQYGQYWLHNRIKVHINITNPADPSFYSLHSIGIIPIADNMMRDHRKIAFFDISESDPYRGMAMFTGMGIGEHYVGANWEDRALMVSGPGALGVKDAARELLLAQGYENAEIPFPLRQQVKPGDYDERVAAERADRTPSWMDTRGSVLQLHNETGFHQKPVNVAKAVLYSLMPPGSVIKVPDSLWQSYLYASLLAGSAQRGCKVLVIAPTLDSAPSGAAPTLARAHGLLGRLIVYSNEMNESLTAAGGVLKVGMYAPRQGVGDIAGRLEQGMQSLPPWGRQVYPVNPQARAELRNTAALLDSIGYEVEYLVGEGDMAQPKIHLKANFFASGTAWQKMMVRPEIAAVVRNHIRYLATQATVQDGSGQMSDVREIPRELAASWMALIEGLVADLSPQEREEMIYYLSVGSTNMDYRSMVMDGEVMVLVGGWQSLYGFMDFMLLPGLCEWMETTEDLDAVLPPPGAFTRAIAGLMKLSL
ncbi:MAG: hypothetical protein QNL91_17960 [Candidatus Krumholzibacteria bacterium]|nr:hypothetical protein [Candidatus Krumholzibacteria bacterium]